MRDIKTMNKMATMKMLYACYECGCPDIEFKVWVHGNTDELISDCEEDFWCPCCDGCGSALCQVDTETGKCQVSYHTGCAGINWNWDKEEHGKDRP
jgi:hypothetical protein